MDVEPAPTTTQETNSDNLKDKEDGSPRPESGSPPPNCAICLGKCKNKCFTDSCFHQFCFKCLLEWSKIKAVCPLCKQDFKSIIHNVRSNHQYDEYTVQQEEQVNEEELRDFMSTRFRYRTTLTLRRNETMQLERILHHIPAHRTPQPISSRAVSASSHRFSRRQDVYRNNMWALPLPDITGRFRDCSPEFFRFNPTQIHRLVPWMQRELMVLLNDPPRIGYVLGLIVDGLPYYRINTTAFRAILEPYLGNRTRHFEHELRNFAMSAYDMVNYDRTVQYRSLENYTDQIISSSDSDNDSDVMVVSPAAGPSWSSITAGPSQPGPPQPSLDNVIAIETITHSDTDDSSSEVMVVGYLKPPQDRTPEIVDLLASDSDVVLHETEPEPPGTDPIFSDIEPSPTPWASLVKLRLKKAVRKRSSATKRGWSLSHQRRSRVPRSIMDSASTSSAVGDTSDEGSRSSSRCTLKRFPVSSSDSNFDEESCSINSSSSNSGIDSSDDSVQIKPKQERSKKFKSIPNKSKYKKKGKVLKRSRSSSSEKSAVLKKKQRLLRKSSKGGKASRSNKAKARSLDQIKSSQRRLPLKKRLHVSNSNYELPSDERPSTSTQNQSEQMNSDEETGNSIKKRLRSVVSVVDSPKVDSGNSHSPYRSKSSDENQLDVSKTCSVSSFNNESANVDIDDDDEPLQKLYQLSKDSIDTE